MDATAKARLVDTSLEGKLVAALAHTDPETAERVFRILADGSAIWTERFRAVYRALLRHFHAGGSFPAIHAAEILAAYAGMRLTDLLEILQNPEAVIPGPALEDLAQHIAQLYLRRKAVALAEAIANAAYRGRLDEVSRLLRSANGLAEGAAAAPRAVHTLTAEPDPVLIPGVLPRRGVAVLAARPKTGKSILAMNLSLALGTGGVFLGHRFEEKAPVLYINLEGGAGLFRQRLDRMLGGRIPLHEVEMDYLDRLPHPLHTPEGLAWFSSLIRRYRAAVVDTLKAAMPGLDFNDYEMHSVVNAINSVATEAGVLVVAIHHANKLNQILGSTGIEGGSEAVLLMKRPDEVGPRASVRTLSVWARSFEGRDLALRLEGEFLTFVPIDDPLATLSASQRAVMELLLSCPEGGLTAADVGRSLDISRRAAQETLERLLAMGLVERVVRPSGSRGRPTTIWIPAKGAARTAPSSPHQGNRGV